MLHFECLTSHGECWTDEEKELHKSVHELEQELAALLPVKQAWIDRGKKIAELEAELARLKETT